MASRDSWRSSPDQVPIVLRWARKDLADVVEGLVERDCTKVRTSASRALGKASISWRSCSLRVIGCFMAVSYGRSLFHFRQSLFLLVERSHSYKHLSKGICRRCDRSLPTPHQTPMKVEFVPQSKLRGRLGVVFNECARKTKISDLFLCRGAINRVCTRRNA